MTTSNRLGITELEPTQADRSATVNEAIARLEGGAVLFACIQVLLNTPPGSPAEGDFYIIGAAGTGVWSSHNKQPTVYYNGAWLFYPLIEGMYADDQSADALYRYDGSTWTAVISGGGGAPANVDYLVKTASGSLSAERVVTDTATVIWDWATSGQAKANITSLYDVPLSFAGTPTTSQKIGKLIAVRTIVFPANFAGSAGHIGTNPTATFAIDVQDNGSSIGTISISTGGTYTFTTASGTAKTVTAGHRIEFVAPSSVDATAALIAATLLGTV